MIANTGSEPEQEPQAARTKARREPINLDYRYGEIGIVAVAAALRYFGAGKSPADAPVTRPIDQRFTEPSF